MTDDNPYASPTVDQGADRQVGELEPPQSVEFWLAEDDVLALTERINAANPTVAKVIRQRKLRLLLISILIGLFAILNIAVGGGAEVLGFPLLAGAVFFGIASLRMGSSVRRSAARFNKKLLHDESAFWFDHPRTASLFEEGFQVSDDDGHWFQYWRAVPSVDVIDTMLIVYRTPSQAICIPSQAFFDEAAFQAFCRLAERLWRQGKQEAEAEDARTPSQ